MNTKVVMLSAHKLLLNNHLRACLYVLSAVEATKHVSYMILSAVEATKHVSDMIGVTSAGEGRRNVLASA